MRRAPGTGTAPRLRKDGRYECRVTIGKKADGRQIQRSVFGHTPEEAEKKRDELVRQVEGGIILAGERLTVERYLRDWLEVKRPAVRASTYTRYRQLVEHNIVPHIGAVPLVKLTPAAIERLMAGLAVAPRTRHHVRAVLRTALQRAVKHGLVLRNNAALADPPRLDDVEQVVLTPDQCRRLLEQVRGDRWEALYVVAMTTGLRQGEILGMRWQDVDLERGSLVVAFQLYRRRLVEPKTKKSRRQVGLGPMAIAALNAHRLRQEQQRRFLVRGDWGNDDGLVFTTGMGGPIHGPHVTRAFQAHLAAAKLPRLPFHALRHTAATLMLEAGVDEKVRRQIMGHSTKAMTAHYTHVLDERLRDAAQRLDGVLAR